MAESLLKRLRHLKKYLKPLGPAIFLSSLCILSFGLIYFLAHVHRITKAPHTCFEQSCYNLSHELNSFLNKNVSPCDDFYEFACGNWIANNQIPEERPTWSIISELNKNNMKLMRDILERPDNVNFTSTERHAQNLYKSCMNTEKINELSVASLYSQFNSCFGFTVSDWVGGNIPSNFSLSDLVSRLLLQCAHAGFLAFTVQADDENSTFSELFVKVPGLLLNAKEYYFGDFDLYKTTFIDCLLQIFKLLHYENLDYIKEMLSDVLEFDREIANKFLSLAEMRNVQLNYEKKPVSTVINTTSSFMDFLDVINKYVSPSNHTIREDEEIVVSYYNTFEGVSQVISYYIRQGKVKILIDYLAIKFLAAFIELLPVEFKEKFLPFTNLTLGVNKVSERWESCVANTRRMIPHGTSRLFIRYHFDEDIKRTAQTIYERIKQTFEERIRMQAFLDNETMIHALKKLSKMESYIGYPALLMNETAIDKLYRNVSLSPDTFFQNYINLQAVEFSEIRRNFRKKVDTNDYGAGADEENASYDHIDNKIRVYSGILRPPMFHKKWPISMAYGSIGFVIGHEITHGFDDQGRWYDSDGNKRCWWSNASKQQFDELSRCFVEEYEKFKVNNISINGKLTLGENIADNGGLKSAFLAYKKHTAETKSTNLPGLNFTSDQLFFIAFGKTWCESSSPKAQEYIIIKDFHAISKYRVLGTLMNMPEFSEAFGCKPNSKMNPAIKCTLW